MTSYMEKLYKVLLAEEKQALLIRKQLNNKEQRETGGGWQSCVGKRLPAALGVFVFAAASCANAAGSFTGTGKMVLAQLDSPYLGVISKTIPEKYLEDARAVAHQIYESEIVKPDLDLEYTDVPAEGAPEDALAEEPLTDAPDEERTMSTEAAEEVDQILNDRISCFAPDEGYEEAFVLLGEQEDGFFTGPARICYPDGSTVSFSFNEDGVIDGEVITVYSDGSYKSAKASRGILRGFLSSYNTEGELTGKERYFRGTLVSEWIQKARTADYEELMNSGRAFLKQAIMVSGTVAEIYATKNQCYYILEDDAENKYLIFYEDIGESSSGKADAPIPQTGDRQEICALMEGFSEPYDRAYYPSILGYKLRFEQIADVILTTTEWTEVTAQSEPVYLDQKLPLLRAIYVQKEGEDVNRANPECTYRNIALYPMSFLNYDISITGTVVYMDPKGKAGLVEVNEGTPEDGSLYLIAFNKKQTEELTGSVIQLTGSFEDIGKLCYGPKPEESAGADELPEPSQADQPDNSAPGTETSSQAGQTGISDPAPGTISEAERETEYLTTEAIIWKRAEGITMEQETKESPSEEIQSMAGYILFPQINVSSYAIVQP